MYIILTNSVMFIWTVIQGFISMHAFYFHLLSCSSLVCPRLPIKTHLAILYQIHVSFESLEMKIRNTNHMQPISNEKIRPNTQSLFAMSKLKVNIFCYKRALHLC